MNRYLKNLSKIEFVVTDACTGRCKHCSQGEHTSNAVIDPVIAAEAVRKITAEYNIKTVMAFGGEPLLAPQAVCAIMSAAKEQEVPVRQLITNGYFSDKTDRIREVVRQLAVAGVNDLLLSVDAFHQETIPLSAVMLFASEVVRSGIPMRLSPAWLVSRSDENPYNRKTRELLSRFTGMGISVGEGNLIFPEGNACIYLADYFKGIVPENPYVEDPRDLRCISFSANGDVLGGNVYRCDIVELLKNYK